MAQEAKMRCTGCSRHCEAGCERCKYGVKYFEKLRAQQEKAHSAKKQKRRKWEKHVVQGGTVWKLLATAWRIKRALKEKRTTEAELLSALDGAKQAQLDALLGRILAAAEESGRQEKR